MNKKLLTINLYPIHSLQNRYLKTFSIAYYSLPVFDIESTVRSSPSSSASWPRLRSQLGKVSRYFASSLIAVSLQKSGARICTPPPWFQRARREFHPQKPVPLPVPLPVPEFPAYSNSSHARRPT